MIEENELIEIGKFFRTHALKGELNAVVEDFDSEILNQGYPLIVEIEGIFVPFYAESVRLKGSQGCLIKLEGIDSKERAQEFVNKPILMLRKDVADWMDMDEDELTTEDDLIGYEVYDDKDRFLGKVSDIDSSTANLLLIVNPGEGSDNIYIPFVEEFIERIEDPEGDDEKGAIYMNLPEGMIDLNQKEE